MTKFTSKRKRPKIVVIGGGTGLPVILNSLHKENADITAVVTVADDGGSSGIIRDYINVVPPGDIRNVLVSLSNLPQVYKDIFQYRFESKDQFFSGHAIGNLVIAALSEMKQGDIFSSVQELSEMMKVDGHVYPAANIPLVLNARFSDGSVISGEAEITAAGKTITDVWVTTGDDSLPEARPEVIQAIMEADQIVRIQQDDAATQRIPFLQQRFAPVIFLHIEIKVARIDIAHRQEKHSDIITVEKIDLQRHGPRHLQLHIVPEAVLDEKDETVFHKIHHRRQPFDLHFKFRSCFDFHSSSIFAHSVII